MTAARVRSMGLAVLSVAAAAACGHKGPPLPPLRPIPMLVADLSIERDGAALRVRVPVPDTNQDGSKPPAVDRVEIYALSQAADAPPPGNVALIVPANLVGTIAIRPPESTKSGSSKSDTPKPGTPKPDAPKPEAPPDPRPAAGDVTTFLDPTAPGASGSVRYYAAVAAAGRRRSRTSAILTVSFAEPPAMPANVRITYTELQLTVAWDAAAAGAHFLVDETDDKGGSAKRLTAPQETTTFERPVEFGKPQCFVVRMAEVHGAVTTVGAPSAPACVTPVDKFPPPAPTSLQAVPGDGGIDLVWSAVQAADLAGYVVLRGDGANGTLQRLPVPLVTTTSFHDATARSGATYVYAVAAADKASPPNVSDPSNRSQATARAPEPRVRRER